MTRSTNQRRLYNIAAAVLLLLAAIGLVGDMRSAHPFDDAYMFVRYAMNIRHGLGVSWNLNGVHTYGQTSLLWCGVVLVLSYLPMGMAKMLVFASTVSAVGALVAIAWSVAANAKSELMSSGWRVLPWIAVPLAGTAIFKGNAYNGMETMLGALLCGLFVGMGLKWQRGEVRPELLGLVGVLLFLTRPESALVVVLFPLLVFALMPGPGWASLLRLYGVFLAGAALDLLMCKLYFHTALPLSFYMKSWHPYKGYMWSGVWHPEIVLASFLEACELYLMALFFLVRREDWRMVTCCVVPATAVFIYLQTVMQIMGLNARYYIAYLAFLLVPALLVIDRWLAAGEAARENVAEEMDTARRWPGNTLWIRSGMAVALVLFFFALTFPGVAKGIRRVENETHYGYESANLVTVATAELPQKPWDTMNEQVTDLLMAKLPRGATVTGSEVGYLGARAAQVNIIDLAGLNDAQIALQGFHMSALLARKPDVIWMPEFSYTYQRGEMFSDPAFYQQYDVYAGAANYGLAIRKDSPFHAQIKLQMQAFWNAMYPGYTMSEYLVHSASWTGAE
ncbi:MAG: hypothetical protein WB439_11780, partial [Acidobacteriaceae bacterium]